jgi:hypothetical protein
MRENEAMPKFVSVWLLLAGAIVLSLAHELIYLGLGLPDISLAAMGWEAAVIFIISLALTYLVSRSRWHGWKLALASFVLLAGVNAFLVMYEMLVFSNPFNVGELLTWWVLRATGITLLVVTVVDKWRPMPRMSVEAINPGHSFLGWVWRIPLAVVAYTGLFMAAGLLAIKLQMVPDYTAPVHEGTETTQSRQMQPAPAIELPEGSSIKVPEPPVIFGFITSRGLVCILLALPLLRSFPAGRWRAGAAIGLALAVFGGVGPLLTPNEDMTAMARYGHMFEISWSNFVYGLVLGGLFGNQRQFVRASKALG